MYHFNVPEYLWQVTSDSHPVVNQVATTREEARDYKRRLQAEGIQATITRFTVTAPVRVR